MHKNQEPLRQACGQQSTNYLNQSLPPSLPPSVVECPSHNSPGTVSFYCAWFITSFNTRNIEKSIQDQRIEHAESENRINKNRIDQRRIE